MTVRKLKIPLLQGSKPTCVQVKWSLGATQPGSSGSPLIDSNTLRIVGCAPFSSELTAICRRLLTDRMYYIPPNMSKRMKGLAVRLPLCLFIKSLVLNASLDVVSRLNYGSYRANQSGPALKRC